MRSNGNLKQIIITLSMIDEGGVGIDTRQIGVLGLIPIAVCSIISLTAAAPTCKSHKILNEELHTLTQSFRNSPVIFCTDRGYQCQRMMSSSIALTISDIYLVGGKCPPCQLYH